MNQGWFDDLDRVFHLLLLVLFLLGMFVGFLVAALVFWMWE